MIKKYDLYNCNISIENLQNIYFQIILVHLQSGAKSGGNMLLNSEKNKFKDIVDSELTCGRDPGTWPRARTEAGRSADCPSGSGCTS